MNEGQAIYGLYNEQVSEGKVRYWVSDGQGGGGFDFITPEERDLRDRWCRETYNDYSDYTEADFEMWRQENGV